MKKIIAVMGILLLVVLLVNTGIQGYRAYQEDKEWQEYLKYEEQLYRDIDAGLYGDYQHILQEWGEVCD